MEKKTTAKKAVAKTAAVEVKEIVKKVEEVKVEAAKVEAPVVAPVEEKAEVKKTTAKKATVKKEVKANVVVQFGGQEVNMDVVVANAKNAFVAEGHKESEIKEFQIYVKPEEYAAYYVINQGFSGKVNLF